MSGHVLFRADGGQRLGLGHIKRCMTLAEELSRRGANATFLSMIDPVVCEQLMTAFFEVETIGRTDDRQRMFDMTATAAARLKPDVVFLDILNTTLEFVRALQESGACVASIDDLGPGGAVVDALTGVDLGVLDELVLPEVREQARGRIFAGLDYAIIDPKFTVFRKDKDGAIHQNANIFIGFGGSDPTGTTAPVVEALVKWDRAFHANVILGPCMNEPECVQKLVVSDERFNVHHNPENLPQLMAESTLAICGVGQSLFELSMLGAPCLLITQSPLHAKFGDSFVKHDSSVHLGAHDGFSTGDMIQWCGKILDDRGLWRRMSAAAMRAIDGNGAGRVCDVIMNLLK